MVDIVSEERRSYIMSRIKGRDTKPEVQLRSALHRAGFRFTVNGPRNRKLPAKPDIVLPAYGAVVLVHGCFWHGHPDCPDFRLPASREEYWGPKIARNRERDHANQAELRRLGWRVVVVWTCAFKTKALRHELVGALAERLRSDAAASVEIDGAARRLRERALG